MKKVLLSSLAMVFAFCLTAQRTVDLAVDEIIKPTMLNSTYVGNSAGTTVESQFVIKNLGTDSVAIGDSIFVGWRIRVGNQIISFPSANSITLFKVADKVLKTGDTIHYNASTRIPFFVNNSGSVTYTAIAEVRNGSTLTDPNVTSTDPNVNNNNKNATITWFNFQNNGVGVTDLTAVSGVSLLGNPVANNISFNLPLVNSESKVSATLVDLTGKQVASQSFDNNAVFSMNVAGINNGIYILNIANGDQTYSVKVTVAK
jgi:hypothetical protein